MKHVRFRLVTVILVAAFLLTGLVSPALIRAFATGEVHNANLGTLLAADAIKPLGRAIVNGAGDAICTDWPAVGFEMNLTSEGGDFVVHYRANGSARYNVIIDGEVVGRLVEQ